MLIITHILAFVAGFSAIPLLFHYGPDPVETFISQYFAPENKGK